jgi:hypothetical protein
MVTIMKKRTTVYLPEDEHAIFKKICQREDDSMSDKIGEFVHQYNLQHGHGNPQKLMTRYVQIEDLPILRIPNVLCNFIIGVTKDRQILCRKRGSEYHSQKVCAECEFNRLGDPYG